MSVYFNPWLETLGSVVVSLSAKLAEVIYNLLQNAIDHSPQKTKKNACLDILDNNLVMSIKDKGIGLSEAEAGKVFKKYFRSAQAVKLNPVGTGVGLNVVKFFVEAHGGTVFVKSEPNKGSTFGFKLPLT